MLQDDGYLLVGHSESLTFLTHDYRYLKPAVYQKVKQPVTGYKMPAGFKGK
jgi:chemotaxis methyl-accepting protein methylase